MTLSKILKKAVLAPLLTLGLESTLLGEVSFSIASAKTRKGETSISLINAPKTFHGNLVSPIVNIASEENGKSEGSMYGGFVIGNGSDGDLENGGAYLGIGVLGSYIEGKLMNARQIFNAGLAGNYARSLENSSQTFGIGILGGNFCSKAENSFQFLGIGLNGNTTRQGGQLNQYFGIPWNYSGGSLKGNQIGTINFVFGEHEGRQIGVICISRGKIRLFYSGNPKKKD